MLRRTSLIMMVFVVLFYPATAIAATNGADAEDTNNVNAEDEADSDEAEAESEEAEATVEDDEDGSDESEAEAEEEEGAEESEGTEEKDGAEGSEKGNEEDGDSGDATEEDGVEDGSAESEEATEEESDDGSEEATEADEEGEEGTEDDDASATDDDELNLNDILGSANGDIVFDDENGYYVLELQAGLSNFTNSQDINDKWVAFAIPPGVEIPDVSDVPGGIYPVTLDNGNNGIAVSIPNIQGIGAEYIYLDIPLIGDPDLAEPDLNLSLFDINVGEDTVDSIGEIGSQRDIDFSVMEGDPDDPGDDPDDPDELDIEASVDGAVGEFDSDERHYNLNLNVDAANNMEEDLDGLYTGFALPEGVAVVDQELPEGVDILDDEGTPVLALELPGMGAGDEGELDYTVPVIGQTDDSVSDAQLHAYAVEEGQYVPLGEIDGTANVDFSEMTEEWGFDALSQIVTGIPGLSGNEFGMNFGFDVQNITLDDVDSVNVEFDVPDAITVYEPDEYIEGDVPGELPDDWDPTDESTGESLDIEWDGNTASINLETLQGSEWNQGFFTAFGESSEALEDLEGMDVTVTLFRDGDEEVREINVPFEIVPYDGGGSDPDPSPDPDPDPDPAPDEDDNGNGGDGDGEGSGGDSGNDNGGDGNGTEDGDKDTDDDQTSGSGDSGSDEAQQGGELPDTAGETPLMMLIGTLIAVAGIGLLAFRKKLLMAN